MISSFKQLLGTPLIFGAICLIGSSSVVTAAPPVFVFDVAQVVECREVGSSEGKPTKFIEAVFRITSEIKSGDEKAVEDIEYQIQGYPNQKTTIATLMPQTELYSEIDGNIIEIETRTNKKSGSAEIGYSVSGKVGPFAVEEAAGAGGTVEKTESSTIKIEKLPPKEILLSSGTRHRSQTAYYRLKYSKQTTLRGQREFAIIFEVPSMWRAGWVNLRCTAKGRVPKWFADDKVVLTGLNTFAVGLYLKGDQEARQLATEIAESQASFFKDLENKVKQALAEKRLNDRWFFQRWWDAASEWLSPTASARMLAHDGKAMEGIYGHQAMGIIKSTSHYRNPLRRFEKAKKDIEQFSGVAKYPK
jgi:hypothetical protein